MSNANGSRGPAVSPWPTRTFTYGPIEITVERQTVRHSIALARIISALRSTSESEEVHQILFARIVSQTVSVKGLDVQFPELGAPDEEWQRAYEEFLGMDGRLMSLWLEALNDVDRPPNAREFWPSHKLSAEERKNRASADSPGKAKSGATS